MKMLIYLAFFSILVSCNHHVEDLANKLLEDCKCAQQFETTSTFYAHIISLEEKTEPIHINFYCIDFERPVDSAIKGSSSFQISGDGSNICVSSSLFSLALSDDFVFSFPELKNMEITANGTRSYFLDEVRYGSNFIYLLEVNKRREIKSISRAESQ